jgi:hypothetical protein
LLLGPASSPQKAGESFIERAEGFWELWSEAEEHLEPTADYLVTAAGRLGECLVYLAASGDKERAEESAERAAVVAGLRPGDLRGYSAYA